jgi:hypothetical protein
MDQPFFGGGSAGPVEPFADETSIATSALVSLHRNTKLI